MRLILIGTLRFGSHPYLLQTTCLQVFQHFQKDGSLINAPPDSSLFSELSPIHSVRIIQPQLEEESPHCLKAKWVAWMLDGR